MAKRKHITELGLNFFSDGLLILHPKDIKQIESQPQAYKDLANNCHIYLLVKRPRLSFVPDSIKVGNGKTSGCFQYSEQGDIKKVKFALNGEANADVIEISKYPHNKLSLIKNGERFFTVPAHLLSLMCNELDEPSLRDLEVVYVGMSYADGKRSAKDRLLSHSTLQQVLSDMNHDEPEMETLILMAQYAPQQTLISFDGRDKELKIEDDRDVMVDIRKQLENITKDLQISLIEASLIRYFEPYYNEKYKRTFPKPTHTILEEVYNIDFGALSVEFNTEELKCRLYSNKRNVGFHHIASYDLHDLSTRRSFFNIMNVENGSDAEDFSGPIF